jgi:hypothetical protein
MSIWRSGLSASQRRVVSWKVPPRATELLNAVGRSQQRIAQSVARHGASHLGSSTQHFTQCFGDPLAYSPTPLVRPEDGIDSLAGDGQSHRSWLNIFAAGREAAVVKQEWRTRSGQFALGGRAATKPVPTHSILAGASNTPSREPLLTIYRRVKAEVVAWFRAATRTGIATRRVAPGSQAHIRQMFEILEWCAVGHAHRVLMA